MPGSSFENRLRKIWPAKQRFAAQRGLTAYRLYDQDIPEYRYVVDVYGPCVHAVELTSRAIPREKQAARRADVVEGCASVLGVPPAHVHVKVKEPKVWGEAQYEKHVAEPEWQVVTENGLSFEVNLTEYLDVGLFLDHRDTRARVRDEARGKRFLNLFCYTGSFTVYAAAGGATHTTSVDLSNTYLAWAERNLARNGLWDPVRHTLVRDDALAWLAHARKAAYDLVVLDPPSFSASKKMSGTFEVQRDQEKLVKSALAVLAPGGVLYFSTNFRGFTLDERAFAGVPHEELTPKSLPADIRDKAIHRCFRFVRAR